jgi:hypothetical protein
MWHPMEATQDASPRFSSLLFSTSLDSPEMRALGSKKHPTREKSKVSALFLATQDARNKA